MRREGLSNDTRPRGAARLARRVDVADWNFAVSEVLGSLQEMEMHKDGDHTVESAVEARGGFLGRPVLVVLILSCALAFVAMGLSYAGFF